MSDLVPRVVVSLFMCGLNGATSCYLAASAEVFWPVIAKVEKPVALIQPPALSCLSTVSDPAEWGLECTTPVAAGIAGVLVTPLFFRIVWRKPKRYLRAALVSGECYALAVVFL